MLFSYCSPHFPRKQTKNIKELQGNKPDNVSGFASHMFEVKIKMESFQRQIPDFG